MDAPSTRLRAAMIGAGAIARAHAQALRAAGFEVTAVAARPGSRRAAALAQDLGARPFQGPGELLAARALWDVLLIAVDPEATPEILREALESPAPILVEKPAAVRSADLVPFLGRSLPVLVGYNRRFYATAIAARTWIARGGPVPWDAPPGGAPRGDDSSPGGFLARMNLPEAIVLPRGSGHRQVPDSADASAASAYLRPFFVNSVHGLDLIQFVFGDVEIGHVARLQAMGGLQGLAALLTAHGGRSLIQLSAMWGSPANFAFEIERSGLRLHISPFEEGTVFEGMDVLPPAPGRPVRTYRPRPAFRIVESAVDPALKPGFLAQAEALKRLALGVALAYAARLEDAYRALRLAEELSGVSL